MQNDGLKHVDLIISANICYSLLFKKYKCDKFRSVGLHFLVIHNVAREQQNYTSCHTIRGQVRVLPTTRPTYHDRFTLTGESKSG